MARYRKNTFRKGKTSANIVLLALGAIILSGISSICGIGRSDKMTTVTPSQSSLMSTPTATPASLSNYLSPPPAVVAVTPIQKDKKKSVKSQTSLDNNSYEYFAPNSSADSSYHLGHRGGCSYYGGTRRKVYVDRGLCGGSGEPKSSGSLNSNGYTLGPRGGCYYLTSGGNKKYVARSLCD
jgi:hypothetical protein